MSFLHHQKGQSLIELLVAMGVFVLAVSTISFLIIDSYVSNRAGRERIKATFLAEEGLEAAKSIRDNNWAGLADLSDGSYHGIATSGNNWIFQGTEDDISDQLREGKREIIVKTIDSDRREVTSQVTWKLTEGRSQKVSLVTYLTNWRRTVMLACDGLCKEGGYNKGKCKKARKCKGLNLGEVGECTAPEICCCE